LEAELCGLLAEAHFGLLLFLFIAAVEDRLCKVLLCSTNHLTTGRMRK